MIVRYAAVGDSFYRVTWIDNAARSYDPVRRVPAAVRRALGEPGGKREAFYDTRTRTAKRVEFWELSIMTTRKNRETIWVAYSDGSEKRVRWRPGYDCRVECVHEVKGEHGQHGDELLLDVRCSDVGVSFVLFLNTRDGKLLDDMNLRAPVLPASLHTHLSFVADVSHLRMSPTSCDVLPGGTCWPGEGSFLAAEDYWTSKDTSLIFPHIAGLLVEDTVMAKCDAVWRSLFKYLERERDAAYAARAALPTLCEHCGGTGLIRTKEARN